MTKGRATLPWKAVGGQKVFFITLGGAQAHDSSLEKHFQEGSAELQIPFDFAQGRLSAALGMTKGEAALPSGFEDAEDQPQWSDLRLKVPCAFE
jgi:hypothetical protein